MTEYNYDTTQPKKSRQAARQTARRDAVERALIHHKIDYSPPGPGRSTFSINTTAGWREANLPQAEWYCQGLADTKKLSQATRRLIEGLSTQTWCDLAPALSCSEAEAVHAFLTAWTDERTARVFMEAHAMSDDPNEGDIHATQV